MLRKGVDGDAIIKNQTSIDRVRFPTSPSTTLSFLPPRKPNQTKPNQTPLFSSFKISPRTGTALGFFS
ncbi:hypothetical protein L6452_40409 [Arctium lappa]|uniref:Uncharacterized protein n=1 Tax=Arctium lappa TaxID=4217 RepID=A0ACB8XNL9_ARCLA|nr:hypothetical protein L6452_40409 [Arctium lappa]